MIPTFAEQDAAASSTELVGRVRQALVLKAGEVRLVTPIDANTWATHRMAQQVLERPDEWARRFAMALVTTEAADPAAPWLTDAQILDGINAVFRSFFEVPPLP